MKSDSHTSLHFVIPSEVEESLDILWKIRDVSTSLDMTKA
jgi:hypothetical protein